MKRTYRKTVVRTIRQSLSRFLAIFAIVALGVVGNRGPARADL